MHGAGLVTRTDGIVALNHVRGMLTALAAIDWSGDAGVSADVPFLHCSQVGHVSLAESDLRVCFGHETAGVFDASYVPEAHVVGSALS